LLVAEGESLPYDDIFAQADNLGARIAEQGLLRKGDRAALMLSSSKDWLCAFIALCRLGVTVVLVPEGLDARMRDRMLADAGCAVMVDAAFLDDLPEQGAAMPGEIETAPDDLVLIAFTSGSTGMPKGVMLDQFGVTTGLRNMLLAGALLSMMERERGDGAIADMPRQMPSQPCTLLHAPFSHVSGYAQALLAMAVGGKLVVAPWANATQIAGLVAEHAVRSLSGGNVAAVAELLDLVERRAANLSTLATVNSHGARLSGTFRRRLRQFLPQVKIASGYGLTETNGAIAVSIDAGGEGAGLCHLLPGVEAKAVDADGNDLPDGAAGELCLRGAMLMRGYCGISDLPRGAWFPSGDLGICDDAGRSVRILGRVKNAVQGLERPVAIEEIEQIFEKEHGISEAFACISSNAIRPTVALFLIADTVEDGRLSRTTDMVRIALGQAWQVQTRLVEDVPRTRSGKVDRAALASTLSETAW